MDFGLWTSDFGLWTLDFGLWISNAVGTPCFVALLEYQSSHDTSQVFTLIRNRWNTLERRSLLSNNFWNHNKNLLEASLVGHVGLLRSVWRSHTFKHVAFRFSGNFK